MGSSESGMPFDDIRALVKKLPSADTQSEERTRLTIAERLGEEPGLLGQLCEWLSAWSGRSPGVHKPLMTLFAGTHGVDGGNDVRQAWLLNEIANVSSGGAAVNRLCEQFSLGLKILDLALQIPVGDITEQDALDEHACAGTIAFGMEAIAGGTDLLCLGAIEREPGVSSMSLLSLLGRIEPSKFFEVADGAERLPLIAHAINRHAVSTPDPLEMLRKLGGRETAAIVGAILAARTQRIPVLVSGPTALAAVAVLWRLEPVSIDHCYIAHLPRNDALRRLIGAMSLKPVLETPVNGKPEIQLAIAAGMVEAAAKSFGLQELE